MFLYLLVRGGWDNSVDEIPEPEIIKQEDLIQIVGDMVEDMAGDPYLKEDANVYPLLYGKRREYVLKLIEDMGQPSDLYAQPAFEELRRIMLEELENEGRLEMMQFWSRHEGSFWGLYKKEV